MSRGIGRLLWLVVLLSGGSDPGGQERDGKDRKGVGWLLITPKMLLVAATTTMGTTTKLKWRDPSVEEKQISVVLRGANKKSDTIADEVIVRETNRRLSNDEGGNLVNLGAEPELNLKKCEGKCNTDFDCEYGLKCFKWDGNDDVPGCVGNAVKGTNYCVTNLDTMVNELANRKTYQRSLDFASRALIVTGYNDCKGIKDSDSSKIDGDSI